MLAPAPPRRREAPQQQGSPAHGVPEALAPDWAEKDLPLPGGGSLRAYVWALPERAGAPDAAAAPGEEPPVLLCLHGAGDSGLAWARLARALASRGAEPRPGGRRSARGGWPRRRPRRFGRCGR
ncbi:unnamed protein product [Prorocentrum cordatum]|uniref:Protein phosphatase methylesterase-1 n=1 Tax=Prorocentrum cordatum TaxID=2364126 RepID=A0ABN9R2B9_9DINO|nr:unnamed protein product [Polarella glacialis]